jgi:RHS repeat-associated protein
MLTVTFGAQNPITLKLDYLRDAEGRPSVVWIPAPTGLSPNNVISYTTHRDALGRPSGLYTGTPAQPTWIVSGATHNAAGRLLQMTSTYFNEARQYNANQQLTRITATGAAHTMDVSYTFPAANNGRAQSTTDHVSGETVTYTYDQLNRLIQAGGMTFEYDGFGNLTKQGDTTIAVNPQTNRISSAGYQYDPNGNLTQAPGATYSYDAANRLVSNGSVYDPRNRRVFDGTYIYLYQADGKLAGRYNPVLWASGPSPSRAYIDGGPNVYFGGRLLAERGQWVMTDRLGSVRVNAAGERSTFRPYGDEATPTTNGRTKFATYMRESSGALDYAMNRYYAAGTGRFVTPDPSASGRTEAPGSWNRYVYVEGDPVNFRDPAGLFGESVENTGLTFSVTTYLITTTVVAPPPTSSALWGGGAAIGGGGAPDTNNAPNNFEDRSGLFGPAGGPASIGAESCTINEYIVGSCEDSRYMGAGLLGRLGARAAGAASVSWWIATSVVGKAGERIVGNYLNLAPNKTNTIYNTLSGINRIPDFWDDINRVIVEVKNVSALSYTAQIRDMAQWAYQEGFTLQLWVNKNAVLTPELLRAEQLGYLTLQRFSWP